MIELYRNPARFSQLAAEADKFTDQHNWPREKTKYYQIVDSMVTSMTSTTVVVGLGEVGGPLLEVIKRTGAPTAGIDITATYPSGARSE